MVSLFCPPDVECDPKQVLDKMIAAVTEFWARAPLLRWVNENFWDGHGGEFEAK